MNQHWNMIIGVTGTPGSGKREIIKFLKKRGFCYRSLPKNFENYSWWKRRKFYKKLKEKGDCVVGKIDSVKKLETLMEMKNFEVFSFEIPWTWKYLRDMKKLVKYGIANKYWKTFHQYVSQKSENYSEIIECIKKVPEEHQFEYSGSIKNLENKVWEVYKKL